jgi:hypothetical protein
MRIIWFIIIVLIFFSFYMFFKTPENITVFKQHTDSSFKISKQLIHMYESNDSAEKTKAKKNIIEITLNSLQYEKWKEYKDYIDIHLYIENVLPKETSQLIIALNLSKDLGVVAIFNDASDSYIFHNKIENIAPVDEIKFLSKAPHPHKMLVIHQTIDEKFGSFFYEKFLQIYYYFPQGFKNVWQKTLYYEEIYKEVWIDPSANPDLWNKIVEETVIDYILSEPLKINTLSSFKKYSIHSKEYPENKAFTLTHSDDYKRSYYWSSQYNTFILGEISKEVFLSNAALLEDMQTRVEALYGFTNKNYKIITPKGEIIYLPKSQFKAMFESLLGNDIIK